MENQQKLQQLLPLMGFKLLVLLIIFFVFSACPYYDKYDNVHKLYVANATSDTIFFVKKEKKLPNYPFIYHYLIPPYENRLFGTSQTSIFEHISEIYENFDAEIGIFKLACADCEGKEIQDSWGTGDKYFLELYSLITWYPPLRSLPDSVHSFYNINSWVIIQDGNQEKWERATFTITEEDLKQSRQ